MAKIYKHDMFNINRLIPPHSFDSQTPDQTHYLNIGRDEPVDPKLDKTV